jgi:hypothetical protein
MREFGLIFWGRLKRPWNAVLLSLVAASVGTAQDPVGPETEFESLLANYSELTTIAGIGKREEDNYWKTSFEGALATEIELSNSHMTMADAAGNYYIADKQSHSILKVDPQGIVTTFAGTHVSGFNGEVGVATDLQLNSPNGLYVLPNGIVYILDFLNRRVRRVDRLGQWSRSSKIPVDLDLVAHFG